MPSSQPKKLILVIGATGAQGLRVIDALLAPSADGTPSPYAVRAFTRNPQGQRAVELASKGVEVVKGQYTHYVPRDDTETPLGIAQDPMMTSYPSLPP